MRLRRAAVVLSSIGILTLALPAVSQDTASRIKSEIERLQKSLKDKPISDPNFAQVGSMVSTALEASRHAADAQHLFVSLESLGGGIPRRWNPKNGKVAEPRPALGSYRRSHSRRLRRHHPVPTMFLFDRSGKTAKILYGAPPDLHQAAEKTLSSLMQ